MRAPRLATVARRLAPRAPRTPGDPSIRPVNFPQHGRGELRLRSLPGNERELVRLALRARPKHRVVLESPEASEIDGIVMLAATGVPLELTHVAPPLAAQLGAELTVALTAPAGSDARERELRSVRLRRLALPRYLQDRFGYKAATSSLSVLLATRRPEQVGSAVQQVASQVGVDQELVVGLHGAGWSPAVDAQIRSWWTGPLVIVRISDDVNLGDVLNELTLRSSGDLLVKWDDDDWYGPHHLCDLALAYEHSGADIVGKAAEFLYLEGSDVTVRRFPYGAETFHWALSGGTLLTSRGWLDDAGGWPAIPAGVDRTLLDRARQGGASGYRTHGFEYVVRRQARPADTHTWTVPDEHFLDAADESRPGLDLGFADIHAHAI